MEPNMHNQDEIKRCFEVLSDLKKRAYKIAPLCTNINSEEEITGMWRDGEDISIGVWSHNCGNDRYEIPMEYFSMTIEGIERAEQKKAELERIRIRKEEARERLREKKAREQRERREYERLKKKFG